MGLIVNQTMLFYANKALAVDTVNSALITEDFQVQINPLDVINKVDQKQAEQIQNGRNKNPMINYDLNMPIVNYSISNMQSSNNINNSNVPVYGNATTSSVQSTAYNPDRPEWIEFCPYGYENASKDNEFHLWGTNSRYKAEDQNYWVERRKDFEKHLAYCDKIQDSIAQSGCYLKLRQRQNRISASYVDPWTKAEIRQEKMRQGLGMWMMYDATKNKNVNVNHSGTVNQNYNVNWHNW